MGAKGRERRLIRYVEGGAVRVGVLTAPDRFAPLEGTSLGMVLAMAGKERDALVDAAMAGAARTLAEVELLPLVDEDAAVWALALNYHSHIAEGAHQRPDHPMMFLRLPRSFAAPGAALARPAGSRQFDYEGELAVFLDGSAQIGGYACCNEGSVREWQRHTSQITPGKNFWRSGSIGPSLRLAGDGYDPLAARLATRVNGREVQGAQVGEMLFGIDEVIAYVSAIAPLRPGDVLLMGTPGGVGFRRDPQLFLEPDDRIEVEIDGLGVLANTVEQRGA